MDAINRIRNQQAQNRANYAESQRRREEAQKRRSQQWKYVGTNADSGKALLQNGSGGSTEAKPVTNGLVKAGQSVRFDEAGRQSQFDAMPRPKRKEEPPATASTGSVKFLIGYVDPESKVLSFFVAIATPGKFTLGTKPILIVPEGRYPESIYLDNKYPSDTGRASLNVVQINNLGVGKDDWIAGISYVLQGQNTGLFNMPSLYVEPSPLIDAVGVVNTITPQEKWQVTTSTDRRAREFFARSFFSVSVNTIAYKGSGFWNAYALVARDQTDGTHSSYPYYTWFEGKLTEGSVILPGVKNEEYETFFCDSKLRTAIAGNQNIGGEQNDIVIATRNSIRKLNTTEPRPEILLSFGSYGYLSRPEFANFVGNEIYDCRAISTKANDLNNQNQFEIKTYQVGSGGIRFKSSQIFKCPIRLSIHHRIYSASYHP